jgi:Zn-dependent protease with chaperone function
MTLEPNKIGAGAPVNGIAAVWFDGTSARRTEVKLVIVGRTVHVVDLQGATIAHVPRDLVKAGDRIGNAPYRIHFPNGALAVSNEHRAIERSFRLAPGSHWLARMERASWVVLAALIGLAVSLVFAYRTFLPVVAEFVAERIPRSSEKTLGEISLKGLDRMMLKPTKLSTEEKVTTWKAFETLSQAAGLKGEVTIENRAMMPNALALPGGTIVITDGLVKLFQGKEPMIAAVLAHELGHVHRRHSLRHLITGSASALIVGALAGDVSGISTLATAAPLVLSTLHYTREMEREADEYAFALLIKAGYSPNDFADAMRRFEVMELCLLLRDSDAEKTRKRSRREPSDEYDGVVRDDEGKSTAASAGSAARPTAKCFSEPEAYLAGRENDIEVKRYKLNERETGYMHSHPVTQERIRAAEAAAKAMAKPQ